MIKITLKSLFSMMLCVISVSSCQMYHPLNTDIPLLEQQGDLHIETGVSFTPLMDGNGLSGTVSYAPIDHLGLQCAGSISGDLSTPDDEAKSAGTRFKLGGSHFQLAIGTFHHVGTGVFEGYLGFSHGNMFHGHHYSINQNTNLFYGQVNYGWNHLCNDRIDVGFGLKVGALSHNQNNDVSVLLEPQAVFRVGGPRLKFSLNIAAIGVDIDMDDYQPLSIEMGIHYKF